MKVAAVAPAPTCPSPRLEGTALTAPLTIDGHLHEPSWLQTQSSGAFLLETGGKPTSPHSEARVLWSQDALFLGLYAADEDLRVDDGFTVRLLANGAPLDLLISANGALSGAAGVPAGVKAAVDVDGTFDKADDFDEEWAVELVIPWAALKQRAPLTDFKMNVSRTDTPKGAAPRTTAWACAGPKAMGVVHLK